ncbi:glutathione S-transferase T3-like [Raphanus sativus]|uniref:Glutathione S-transferase T3-like n=1 Tax=Raphanus sativus TaxID=3726 RepID=A0A9W3CA16_RAPSA|nr:glutathione S-transferase T3-like [Raphanus sativus]XP_056850656.1 glutathione S-transferase T3-like [Raphanus sativus]
MDFNPFTQPSNFVDLLSSQQNVVFGNLSDSVGQSSSQVPFLGSQGTEDSPPVRKERRTWTPEDDVVLISSWLNTSKDPIVGNEQKCDAFWKRVAAYYSASRKGSDHRALSHCKNRWQKINDHVCKFSGAYDAATRQRTSGQNENDVLRLAHIIYFTKVKKKFTLEHAWKELRHDQKWCSLSTAKKDGSSKKKRCEDGSESANSKATEEDSSLHDESTKRPMGVKAAKKALKERLSKKTVDDGKELSDFQTMWGIKMKDLEVKERMSKINERKSKMKLLASLYAKQEPLADYEEALKKKLSEELM